MQIIRELTINVPADHVWQIVAHEFAKVGEWASAIAASKVNVNATVPDGAQVGGRVCVVPGFNDIRETFTAYDEANKTFTYAAAGLPFFITSAHNSWVVRAIDANTTHVSFRGDVKLLPVLGWVLSIPFRLRLNRILQNTIEELKYYVETGNAHPRKLQRLAQPTPHVTA